ncbi:MAG TPA: hypothetical protein VGO93_06505, partial [Candidatus Xenobia bacterium]
MMATGGVASACPTFTPAGDTDLCCLGVPLGQQLCFVPNGSTYQKSYAWQCFGNQPITIKDISFESATSFPSACLFAKIQLGTTSRLGTGTCCSAHCLSGCLCNNFNLGSNKTVLCSKTSGLNVSN